MLDENYKLAVAGSRWEHSRQEEGGAMYRVGSKGLDEEWGVPGRAYPRLDFLPSSHAPFHSANILGGIHPEGLKENISPGVSPLQGLGNLSQLPSPPSSPDRSHGDHVSKKKNQDAPPNREGFSPS